jgi:hypothetical protein
MINEIRISPFSPARPNISGRALLRVRCNAIDAPSDRKETLVQVLQQLAPLSRHGTTTAGYFYLGGVGGGGGGGGGGRLRANDRVAIEATF